MSDQIQFTIQLEKQVFKALGNMNISRSELISKLVEDFLNMEPPDLLFYYKPELNFVPEGECFDTLDLGCGLYGGEQLEKIIQKFKDSEFVKIRTFCVDSIEYKFPREILNQGMLIRLNSSIQEFLNNCSERFDLIYSRNALDLLELDSEAQVQIVDTYRRIFELLKQKGVALLITKSEHHFRKGKGNEWFYLDNESIDRIKQIHLGKIDFYKHGFYDVCIMIK